MTERAQVAAGRALGSRYELNEVLGRGAMGAVWSATDRQTGEIVAAKVLHEQYGSDVNVVTRFVQERSILLSLRHPHIVAVRDLVVEGSNLAIVMDLVRGSDVRHHLREAGTLAPAEAVGLIADVLEALAAAHAAGVVHRDVKPDNILLDSREDGTVALLSDFGVARLAQESQVRMSGLLGTADYMAPETFLTNEVGASSDVYAAGITLYELLAGRTPYAGESASANAFVVARHHANSLPPAIPGLAAALAEVLDSLLVKAPRQRPTAKEAAAALRRLAPELAGVAPLAPMAPPTAWESVATPVEVGTGPLPGSHSAPVDPDGTMIGVARRSAAGGPLSGSAPVADVSLNDAPATQLGGRVASRDRAVDLPDVAPTALPESSKISPLVWVAGVVAVLALVGGGFALFGRGGGPSGADAVGASGAIEVQRPPVSYPAQFTLTRSARVDEDQVTVTLAWTNTSSVARTGPFFEVVPGFDGDCLPLATWTGGTAADVVADGFRGACALSITPDSPIDPQQTVPVSYSFSLPDDIEAEKVEASLDKMLAAEESGTQKPLTDATGTTAFAVQRFTDIEVVVREARIHDKVDLMVYPVWGSEADKANPIYSSASPDESPDWASQLGRVTLNPEGCSALTLVPASAGHPGWIKTTAVEANCQVRVAFAGQEQSASVSVSGS